MINIIFTDLDLLTGSKLIDVHFESILESHVHIVGLPAVHRVPEKR